jgi:hypothetical protein
MERAMMRPMYRHLLLTALLAALAGCGRDRTWENTMQEIINAHNEKVNCVKQVTDADSAKTQAKRVVEIDARIKELTTKNRGAPDAPKDVYEKLNTDLKAANFAFTTAQGELQKNNAKLGNIFAAELLRLRVAQPPESPPPAN